jgi:SAM-dependent methyltransferase
MVDLNKNLIQACTCANDTDFSQDTMHNILVLVCGNCGVIHQYLPDWDHDKLDEWYRKHYHSDVQEAIGHQSYHARYENDRKVAMLRLDAYQDLIKENMIGLDIGSSNSAFVHACRERGINCWGVEPGESIGDDSVTIRSTIEDCDLDPSSQDFVTMHDSLEHIVDVDSSLNKLQQFLKPRGILIVDIPDYFSEAGIHHWRIVQHLWFWNQEQMTKLFSTHGLDVFKVTRPIPGKIVFFCEKK